MQQIPIDLSSLTPEERQQFADTPEVLSPSEDVCCLYLRYSSDRQTEQSIEGQLRDLISHCKSNRYRIAAVYVDRAISAHASMDNRPAFMQMLSDSARSPWSIVLVWKLDRFARKREDSAVAKMRLRKNGVRVESAKENISKNPEGIILESVLEGIAEYYSAELSQKIKRGMNESALKGQAIGGSVPLGLRIEKKKWEIDPLTAPLVKEAFQRYAAGESAAAICDDFNNRGFRSSKGAKFNKSSFKSLFKNEKYIGVYKFKDIRVENAIPSIVDADTWAAVQSRLKVNAEAPARGKAKVAYLLAGKIFCGRCGSPMRGESGHGKSGRTYNYYACGGRKSKSGCKKKPMIKDWIENIVVKDALECLTPEMIDYISTVAARQSEDDIRQLTQIPAIQKKVTDLSSRINNLLKALEAASSAPDSVLVRISELEDQKKALEAQLITEERSVVRLKKEKVSFWLTGLKNGQIDLETQKAMLLDLFVNSVTIWDNGPDGITVTTAYNLTQLPTKTFKIPVSDPPSAGSDLESTAPPFATNPNTVSASNPNSMTVIGIVFVRTKCHALP